MGLSAVGDHPDRLPRLFPGAPPESDLDLLTHLLAGETPESAESTAKALLRHFGSVNGLLNAPHHQLLSFKGGKSVVPEKLHALRQIALRGLEPAVLRGPVFPTTRALIDYLRLDMAHRQTEALRILYLNARNALIRDVVIDHGFAAGLTFRIREVLRTALEVEATGMILAHNHPCGDCQPSQDDIETTRKLRDAAANLDITLHEHVIIARNGWLSLKAEGLF